MLAAARLTVAVALLLAIPAGAAAAKEKEKIPSKLVGKAFFSIEPLKDQSNDSLVKMFEKDPPKPEVKRPKKGSWQVTLVAFCKKPPVDGPMTIWVYDKTDKQAIKDREPIQMFSVDAKAKAIFVNELTLDPDQGYNGGHSYVVMVGQLIAKKEKIYATGEVKLVK